MAHKFTVPGEPKAKARPRVTKGGITYTPKDTVIYENLVKMCYRQQVGKFAGADNAPITLHIDAYFTIPKSTSQKKRREMLAGVIRPTKKPDGDNIYKIVADSLNGIAYKDDSQIVDCIVRKWYADVPRVEVILSETATEGEIL